MSTEHSLGIQVAVNVGAGLIYNTDQAYFTKNSLVTKVILKKNRPAYNIDSLITCYCLITILPCKEWFKSEIFYLGFMWDNDYYFGTLEVVAVRSHFSNTNKTKIRKYM